MENKVTMYTLASELNMSIAAISRAFNPNSKLNSEKRKLILDTAEKMGYVPNKMASRLSQSAIRIGILIYGYMAVYDDEIIAGITRAYHELQDYKIDCDIRRLKSGEDSLEDALAVLDEFADAGYDAVLLNTLPDDKEHEYSEKHHTAQAQKINELTEKGIKVALFDRDIPDCGRLFVSMNNIEVSGKMAVELLSSFIKDEVKNIAVFFSGKYDLLDVFCKNAKNAGMNIIDPCYLSIGTTAEEREIDEKNIETLFSAHPEINGVYINFANCLPVCEYLSAHDAEHKVTFIASDIFDEMRRYVRDGTISASIYQDPSSQGYNALKSLYFNLADKKDVDEHLLAHPQIIMKSNIDLF